MKKEAHPRDARLDDEIESQVDNLERADREAPELRDAILQHLLASRAVRRWWHEEGRPAFTRSTPPPLTAAAAMQQLNVREAATFLPLRPVAPQLYARE